MDCDQLETLNFSSSPSVRLSGPSFSFFFLFFSFFFLKTDLFVYILFNVPVDDTFPHLCCSCISHIFINRNREAEQQERILNDERSVFSLFFGVCCAIFCIRNSHHRPKYLPTYTLSLIYCRVLLDLIVHSKKWTTLICC